MNFSNRRTEKLFRLSLNSFLCLFTLILAACSPESAVPTATQSGAVIELLNAVTAVPTVSIPTLQPSPVIPTFTATSEVTATIPASNTPESSSTPLPPTETLTQPPTVTPSLTATLPPPTIAAGIDHYHLQRPIARSESLVDWADRTYPYGGTQSGARQVHTGIDFFNVRFTPVLAAAEGRVIFAGKDDQTVIGSDVNYYGNVVIIQHDFLSPSGVPVFTLYGHLQEINVKAGNRIFTGDPVGLVGDSGIAIGPHLHFEVRVGDAYDFYSTQNPELWMKPYSGFGTLTGKVTSDSQPVDGRTILVRSGTRTREAYVYAAERVNSDPVWNENFILGDLPTGSYDVIFSDNGRVLFKETVSIYDGRTTFVEINIP